MNNLSPVQFSALNKTSQLRPKSPFRRYVGAALIAGVMAMSPAKAQASTLPVKAPVVLASSTQNLDWMLNKAGDACSAAFRRWNDLPTQSKIGGSIALVGLLTGSFIWRNSRIPKKYINRR